MVAHGSRYLLVFVICLTLSDPLIATEQTSRRSSNADPGRPCAGFAVYRLTFETFWTKERYPKQYPLYRPPAQWSKLIGRTHCSQYSLWEENKVAGPAVHQFTSRSISTLLDNEAQGEHGIFDVFVAPNIKTGAGLSRVNIHATTDHSKLSTVAALIPSPDWFVGVSNLDLCGRDGHWTDSHVIDLYPMDAGFDRGLTFSSPRWTEKVPQPVSRITSKVPAHPVASFFYPELDSLTALARLTAKRINGSEFSGLSNSERSSEGADRTSRNHADSRNPQQQQQTDHVITPRPPPIIPTTRSRVTSRDRQRGERMDNVDHEALRETRQRHRQRKNRNRRLRNGNTSGRRRNHAQTRASEVRGRVDCEVSDWTDWSACSKTCGYGKRSRTRRVLRQPRNRGSSCPPLKEDSICGTMSGCDWQHFRQMSWE